jgi:sulfatase maturation enzyme AslB (radical SAM superfamily)
MATFKDYINGNSFCILPFIHQEKKFNGTHHVCCYGDQLQSDYPEQTSLESFNSKKINIIREKMIEGVRPSECDYCYKLEDQNISSPRNRENQTWGNWGSTHNVIEKTFTDYLDQRKVKPISYDLRYSNTCTLKCRMCNSSSSSALNAEYKKINHRWPEKFWFTDNPRINHELELHADIQKIYLAGGEPLVEPLNLELLDKLADYNPNLVILINTSLNHLSDKFVGVLNKFKYLTLVVSIDGTNEINDYIRHGSNFDVVVNNIRKMMHHDIMFSTCVSMYNIFNIKKLIEFIAAEFPKYAFNHGINIVNDAEEIFVENLPYELRPAIINELKETLNITKEFASVGVNNLINLLQQDNFNKDRFHQFINYTKILDEVRQESIVKVVPQLAKFFNE